MKKTVIKVSLIGLLCLLVLTAGCCINITNCFKAKYERIEKLSMSMTGQTSLSAATSFGDITVRGDDVTDCNVTAKIKAQAPSEDEAEQIGEAVKIYFIDDGEGLKLQIDKPKLDCNRSIGVSLKIIVPRRMSMVLDTSYGDIDLENLNGSISSNTSFGDIDCKDIEGRLNLNTSYGDIDCRKICSEDISVETSFGDVDVSFLPSSPARLNADVDSSYGDIDFTAPSGFAGIVDMKTSGGSIRTNLPVTVSGEIKKQQVKGSVGTGEGKLELKTSFGSIRLK